MYEYPFGNGQQLNLDWFLNEWKNLLAAWEAEKNGIEGALQAEIDRAEAALADVFAARDAAAQSATAAGNSADAAAQSASDASGYLATVRADAQNAAESAQTALASKNAAGQSERNAAQSEANANSSKNAAGQSERNAAQSEANANSSKNAAAQSAADALANKNAAAQSAEDAEVAAASVEASAQQITTNTSDISNLKESIKNKANIITNTEIGEIVSFADGADNINFESIKVMIKPLQSGSGDPSPTNVRNITGHTQAFIAHTGISLLDKTKMTSGRIMEDGTVEPYTNRYVSDFILVKPNTQYYIESATPANNGRTAAIYDINKNFITTVFISGLASATKGIISLINADACYIRCSFENLETAVFNYKSSYQDTYTFRGETINVSWEIEANIVYGGVLNLVTGVLTITMILVQLANCIVTVVSPNTINERFKINLPTAAKAPNSSSAIGNIICSELKTLSADDVYNGTDLSICLYPTAVCEANNKSVHTAEDFKASLPSATICYEIANPTTVTLTPQEISTLLGVNNIIADVGNIEATYKADTKLYIDNKIAELESTMLENIGG